MRIRLEPHQRDEVTDLSTRTFMEKLGKRRKAIVPRPERVVPLRANQQKEVHYGCYSDTESQK